MKNKDFHYVYKITHTPTGHYYVGRRSWYSADDRYLGSGVRWNKEFVDVYPRKQFHREILWHGNSALLKGKEEHFIELHDGPLMMNSMVVSGGVITLNEHSRNLVGVASRERGKCPEYIKNQSNKNKEWTQNNPEAEAERQAKSTASKNTPEYKAAASLKTSAQMTPERREFQRQVSKNLWKDPEFKAKKVEQGKKQFETEESRKAHGELNKIWIKNNPEAEAERQRKSADAHRTPEWLAENTPRLNALSKKRMMPIEVSWADGRVETYPSLKSVPGVPQDTMSDLANKKRIGSRKYGILSVDKI